MKKFLFLILLGYQTSYSMPIDTSVFRYFPLNVGNTWTWHRDQNYSPGPGSDKEIILRSKVINNKRYYITVRDMYYSYSNTHNIGIFAYHIDTLNGNLYTSDTLGNLECLLDSLNSRKGDSATICQNERHGCDTGSYNIFNQNFATKIFGYTFFEGGGNIKYSKGIGKVYEFGQAMMSQTTQTLMGCIINGVLHGDTTLVGLTPISNEIPDKFSISQNYPNPFNPNTIIKFKIANSSNVRLIVYDILGKEVITIVNEELKPGTYDAEFDGTNLPSGVYYYKLETADYSETKKMVLIK